MIDYARYRTALDRALSEFYLGRAASPPHEYPRFSADAIATLMECVADVLDQMEAVQANVAVLCVVNSVDEQTPDEDES